MDTAAPPGIPAGNPIWHQLSPQQVLDHLDSTTSGLAVAEAAARLSRYGPNQLPVKPPPGAVTIFLHQFFSPLIYILLVAGTVSLLIGEHTDAGFIFAVILLNAGLGTFQEWKAEKSAANLQQLLKIRARVRRDNRAAECPAEDLVAGDIVLLESGQRVPADLRLLQVRGLTVDESLLTGESAAVDKQVQALAGEISLGERRNLAFAGSVVTSGRGLGVVIGTGLETEVGQIARAVTEAGISKPPLVIRMERFARQISYLVLGFVSLLAIVSHLQGTPWQEVFFMAIALAVSAIPEGLPVAMTVALSIATSRMARRQVIVRKLTAVEGLGSCTCIASDKTGTLTVNRQTVKNLWLPGEEEFQVTGEGYHGEGQVLDAGGRTPEAAIEGRLALLASAGALCNEATLTRSGNDWSHQGDAMDVALLALAWKLGFDPDQLRDRVDIRGEIPYESELRYAARLYWDETGNWVLKGAVERVLDFCDRMLTADGEVPLAAQRIADQAETMASAGFRVLAIAWGRHPDNHSPATVGEEHIPQLCLLGLVGFIDPLRPEAAAAVATCRQAGVEVKMITGDHPATALAIARGLGLGNHPWQLVTGSQLDAGEEIETLAARAQVFARVSPLQKLQLVEAFGRLGHFIAVTGDGVNDAPALRKAHIGVAMGSGTDVAKETASIIVTDDNFASIVAGIEEGRHAYANIRKVVYLLISTGGAEIVLFTLALLCGLPLPLLAVQLLWLNLVTNGIQDVALAFEGGEPGSMLRPPRPPSEAIFNRLMIRQTVVSGLAMGLIAFAAWLWLQQQGRAEAESRNLLLLLMVLLENVHVFNCRSETVSAFRIPLRRNRLLIGGVVAAQGLHILLMHHPLMQRVLNIQPVSLPEWASLLAMALLLLLVMELFKRFNPPAAKNLPSS